MAPVQRKNATSCWLKQDTHTHSDTHTHIMHACPYASPANQHHWFYPQSLMAQFPFTVNLAFSRLSNGIRLLISNRGAPKFASSGSTQPQWQGKSNPHTSALEGAHSCDCWLLDLALQPLLTVQFDQNIFCSTPGELFKQALDKHRHFAAEPRPKERTLMFELLASSFAFNLASCA